MLQLTTSTAPKESLMDVHRLEDAWSTFFSACLIKRVSAKRLLALLTTFEKKHPCPSPRALTALLLQASSRNGPLDPRLPSYITELLVATKTNTPAILSAALPSAPADGRQLDQSMLETAASSKPSMPAIVIQLLTIQVSEGSAVVTADLQSILKHLIPWMELWPSSAALAYFISVILGCAQAPEVLNNKKQKGLHDDF